MTSCLFLHSSCQFICIWCYCDHDASSCVDEIVDELFFFVFFLTPPPSPPVLPLLLLWFCDFILSFCLFLSLGRILKKNVEPSHLIYFEESCESPPPRTCAFWLRVRLSVSCRGWSVVVSALLWFLFPLWSSDPRSLFLPPSPPPPNPSHSSASSSGGAPTWKKKKTTKCLTESVNNQRKHKG